MKGLVVAAGVVALGAPGAAHANSGIGFLLPAVPVMVLGLVPAIVVEASVFVLLLRLAFRRAIAVSLAANFASTVAGFAAAIGVDLALGVLTGSAGAEPGRAVFLGAMVPMFFLTWLVEAGVVKRMQRDTPRVGVAVLAANLLSYALLAGAILILLPPGDQVASRWKVAEALAPFFAAKMEVAEHHMAQRQFPPPRALPTLKNLRSLTIEAEGRIVAVFSFPASADVDGKRVILEPRVSGDQITAWVCHSPDMPAKYLPTACR